MKQIEKVLTFRAASIGDCMMACYMLTQVHAQYPHARLGIVVSMRGSMIRSLLQAYPMIEVHEVRWFDIRGLVQLWKRFARSDIVLTQYAGKPGGKFSLRSKIAARLLAKKGGLYGFADASVLTRLIYDCVLPFDPEAAPAQMERAALQEMHIAIHDKYPTLKGGEIGALEKFDLSRGSYVLVHLFSGSDKRGLSPDRQRALVLELVEKMPDTKIVLTGAASEKEAALRAALGTGALTVAGQTTLQELFVLLQQSKCVVAVDTGVAHIAAALKVPLVVLTTCLGKQWWAPEQYGAAAPITVRIHSHSCIPHHALNAYPPCINEIAFSEVAACAVERGSLQ